MNALLKKAASSIGVEVRRTQPISPLQDFDLLNQLRGNASEDNEMQRFLRFVISNLPHSRSQIFQDLFVLFMLKKKRDGYFVKFGAGDGNFLSNSVLLEKEYGWTGIAAEPCKSWHNALKANRECIIDPRCVWDETGRSLTFCETPDAVLSTLSDFKSSDGRNRADSKLYPVETVSLNDLLDLHQVPKEIDYLSIDTEGSELTILRPFDFTQRSFRIITVEHNYSRHRRDIFSLLTSNGYRRVFESITMWDDWYVR